MKTQFASTALIIAFGLIAATPSYAQLTREQVKAELAQAQRTGDYMADGEVSAMCKDLHPNMHPAT